MKKKKNLNSNYLKLVWMGEQKKTKEKSGILFEKQKKKLEKMDEIAQLNLIAEKFVEM